MRSARSTSARPPSWYQPWRAPLDGSRSPFDQLAEIVDAVGDTIDVICDGGIGAVLTCSRRIREGSRKKAATGPAAQGYWIVGIDRGLVQLGAWFCFREILDAISVRRCTKAI